VRALSRAPAAGGVAIDVLAAAASTAAAVNLRNPQVPLNGASLQAYLNGVGEAINVATDQVDVQVWTTGVSGNATLTLMIELTGSAAQNSIGVYNTGVASPPLFQIFPAAATTGWFATAHFAGGNMVVTLFDNNSIIQGQIFYGGVNAGGFGFYISGPGGTFYSEDSRNGGAAQILTYLGTGVNFGEWWECFEDQPYAAGDKDFEDAVLLMQSIVPTDAIGTSWGRLKTLYRK
jgi:hypothetical protein